MKKSFSLFTKPVSKCSDKFTFLSGFHTSSVNLKVLTVFSMNENIKYMEYAIRGSIPLRAANIERELLQGVKKPFDRVLRANIGDCHATGQKPITFLRQVMAMCTLPELLDHPEYPSDVKELVRRILADCKGNSVGSYTESEGLRIVREDVAKYITNRDGGVPSDWKNIYLTTGASDAIRNIMEMLLSNRSKVGFMIPIPQYSFYTATISEFNAHPVGYYLNEDKNWGLDIDELQKSYDQALYVCEPRAIVVINPGNPTGQVLSKSNIQNVIKFAHANNLFILADEVYQDNIYIDDKFHSFKQTAYEMGPPYSQVEIASFYSTSKGYMGECGVRSGYMEVINLDPIIQLHLDKLSSIRLCSSSIGQACMAAVVNPPKPGDPSYDLFIKEKQFVMDSLKEKAKLVTEMFNSIKGMSCNPVQGAMYAFPKINIPKRAIEKAKSLQMAPDVFYCFQLLEKAGICLVPGSGFHQKPGTYHFRTTILPPIDQIKVLLGKFEKFHSEFEEEWADEY